MEMITCYQCKKVMFGLEQSQVFKVTGEARIHIKCEGCKAQNQVELYEYGLVETKIVNSRGDSQEDY